MDGEERVRFGLYLKNLRKTAKMSLRGVEAEAGISRAYLYQIESAQRNPPRPEMLRRLARLYKVSINVMMAAAGLYEVEDAQLYEEEFVERAYEYICRDPEYSFGYVLTEECNELTLPGKRFLVEMYAKSTGTDLLAKLRKREEKP